ncbi:anthranilate synthase component I [Bacillus sp. PS06]|uniref:anthranilate synthase component I n=1 Tax=Bacillus sp. PS06 TaxID=2764176 RepID=UPI00177C875E|nr:anthranilate synthase component I [Bacillus sp. PS06]MBD8070248.1 anthranilate synthase component I [Bacillus sp. PS06]
MKNEEITSFLSDSSKYKTIPIIKRFIVDTLTPIQIFQNVESEASFLLESKDEESSWSRYSFIGLKPFLFIQESSGVFSIKNESKQNLMKKPSLKEAFNWVEKSLAIKKIDLDIPFSGGAVGYLGYDSISTFEKVEENPNIDLNVERQQFFFCETIIAYDHHQREVIFIHNVRLTGEENEKSKRAILAHAYSKIDMYISKIMQHTRQQELYLENVDTLQVSFEGVKSNYKKEKFIEDVNKIKDYISAGDVFQAVLSQRFEIPIKVTGFQLYRVLRTVNPSPYLFYIKIDDLEIVGSSPERLIKIDHSHLEIHPIAGTRRRGRTEEEDLQLEEELKNDKKEQAEHYMLVDLARNDIGRVAKYGSVNTPVLMELGRFSHVMHLISKVTGVLDEKVDPIDALIAAFPAGTVSGAPKIRAMQILNELEPTARNLYAGTVAYIGFDGNIDSCITIRTIVLKDGVAYVQAGAGVVADSVPELEWKETRNKASALIKTIEIAQKTFEEQEDSYVSATLK